MRRREFVGFVAATWPQAARAQQPRLPLVGYLSGGSASAAVNLAAGFRRGLVQGALMPMALPNLIVGNDVTIYSQNNTGLTYKLGYTAGVNACGAVFFGLFFWRVNRWRRKMNNNRRD